MKLYAVSHLSLEENDITTEIICADTWVEALSKHPALSVNDLKELNIQKEDKQNDLKIEAFYRGWVFNVVEIPEEK